MYYVIIRMYCNHFLVQAQDTETAAQACIAACDDTRRKGAEASALASASATAFEEAIPHLVAAARDARTALAHLAAQAAQHQPVIADVQSALGELANATKVQSNLEKWRWSVAKNYIHLSIYTVYRTPFEWDHATASPKTPYASVHSKRPLTGTTSLRNRSIRLSRIDCVVSSMSCCSVIGDHSRRRRNECIEYPKA